jgi:hypothetical protein
MIMADELKACPYACQVRRGPRVEVDQDEWEIARVICGDCGASGPFADLSDYGGDEVEASKRAIRMWNTRPLTGGVTEEMVEAACFAWLRSLFPSRATDDEIRARINDTDREHVRYILEAAVSALAMSNASRGG